MSAKIAFPASLVLTALSLCAARAQTPSVGYPTPGGGIPASVAADNASSPNGNGLPPVSGPLGPAGQTTYQVYPRPASCCGPIGGDGPIGTELYLRSGVAFNLGGTGNLGKVLQNGWVIDAGARSLFFDPDMSAAWAVSYGVSNVSNHSNRGDVQFPLQVLVPAPDQNTLPTRANFGQGGLPGVTIRNLNRTFLNLGGGRDWWLWGAANSCEGPNWRVGFDVGGRYGTASVELNELRHRTDVIGGVWAALHSDLEFPCGCGVFVVGLRLEWTYTWSDIMQLQNDSDLMELNLLLNFGLRF
jgi:hypothetical protein